MLFGRIVSGLIMIAIGVLLLIKTDLIMSWSGRIAWAEEKLGSEGGTRIFYKLIGMGFIVLAFMVMSGKIFGLLDWVFKRGV